MIVCFPSVLGHNFLFIHPPEQFLTIHSIATHILRQHRIVEALLYPEIDQGGSLFACYLPGPLLPCGDSTSCCMARREASTYY